MQFDSYSAYSLPTGKLNFNIECGLEEWTSMVDTDNRRLYLSGEIASIDCEDSCMFLESSKVSRLIENIMDFNRLDFGVPEEEREPVRLYINSPGGELIEGFALIAAIELSKTPIYTINMGQWSSMAFLIGISGKKRFSLPNAMFLMHDGTSGAFGSTSKVQDQVKFEESYNEKVVKAHILKHSNMKPIDYDALARVELYMLPEDALARGFIDEIVEDIDTIL